MREVSICIIGLGPWGLCVLERITSRAKRTISPTRIRIHIIEKGEPGVGVHYTNLPDYLLLNTKCGHVSMFVDDQFPDIEDPVTGPSLLTWAHRQGYRIPDSGYGLSTSEGRDISPDDFLPRRILAEYLSWFYRHLVDNAPRNIAIDVHRCEATDVSETHEDQRRVKLENGVEIQADFVFLTTGHTPNATQNVSEVAKDTDDVQLNIHYPLEPCLEKIRPDESVALTGFGLVAIDVLTGLTIGRGGKFSVDPESNKRFYTPSGLEPTIYMLSRSGAPYCARPAISKDPSQFGYQAAFFTPEEIDTRRQRNQRQHGDIRLDILKDVLPILWDEMKLVYYQTAVRLAKGEDESERVRSDLIHAWQEGRFNQEITQLATTYQYFDPESYVLYPMPARYVDEKEYNNLFLRLVQDDLNEAYKGEIDSPHKAALELFRVLRGVIRYAVDFGGLLTDSQILFSKRIASLINRVIVGPPKERLEELMALMDAGIVKIPFGPVPSITIDHASKSILIRSTAFDKDYSERLDRICYARLGHPSVERSQSRLISQLRCNGSIKPFIIDGVTIGGIHLDRNLHPVGDSGQSDQRLFVLGPLAEGIRYFNHYIPSPTSRILAFRDADHCARQILAYAKSNITDAQISASESISETGVELVNEISE